MMVALALDVGMVVQRHASGRRGQGLGKTLPTAGDLVSLCYRLPANLRTIVEAMTVAATDTEALRSASLKSSTTLRLSGGTSLRNRSLKGRPKKVTTVPARALTNHFCFRGSIPLSFTC